MKELIDVFYIDNYDGRELITLAYDIIKERYGATFDYTKDFFTLTQHPQIDTIYQVKVYQGESKRELSSLYVRNYMG